MNGNDGLSDLELVEKVKGGDRQSFSTLVRRHQKGLMRLSLRFMKDPDAAEDIVQDSFIKAFERLNSFEARSSFKSWLYQIAINTAKNKLRDRMESALDVSNIQLGVSAKAETGLIHSSVAATIRKFVDELPDRQKTALVLRVYEDLSFKEIADIMDCPYDTAKANYRHALLKLKSDLEVDEDLRHWTAEVGNFVTEITKRAVEADA